MSAVPQPLNASPPSHRLQEYERVRGLGFGGFDKIYRSFDHNLDKPVAIKEYLLADIATRTASQRLSRRFPMGLGKENQ